MNVLSSRNTDSVFLVPRLKPRDCRSSKLLGHSRSSAILKQNVFTPIFYIRSHRRLRPLCLLPARTAYQAHMLPKRDQIQSVATLHSRIQSLLQKPHSLADISLIYFSYYLNMRSVKFFNAFRRQGGKCEELTTSGRGRG